MSSKKWLDNAFWETEEKQQVNCILELEDDVGRVTRQVMKLNRTDKEGNPNSMFDEVLEELGEESIDKNTQERHDRKNAEKQEQKQRDIEHKKARKLEELFNYKLTVFEVDEIKNSKNRKLKGKLRRAKSEVEVQLWAIEIMRESMMENEDDGKE
jgi:hypothetical protein